ncbi:hypothetical protein J1614_002190 [Plenodomus biglobosus]|nr:hypothetical protein J1614_002190 [Plenodomus biglobosus]
MSPHASKCWRLHCGGTLEVFSPALLDDIPCARIGHHAARSDLGAADGTDDGDLGWGSLARQERSRYEEVKWSSKYINEVVGYDVLQGRTADGSDFDDDDGYDSGG